MEVIARDKQKWKSITTLDILEQAYTVLQEKEWCRNYYWVDELGKSLEISDETVEPIGCCLEGAVLWSAYLYEIEPTDERILNAMIKLSEITEPDTIEDFNDSICETKEEALDLIQQAIIDESKDLERDKVWCIDNLKGQILEVTQDLINESDINDTDNPISNSFKPFVNKNVVVDMCLIGERIAFYNTDLSYLPKIYTTTALEDWYREYLNDESSVEPIKLIVHTLDADDYDFDDDEDEEFVQERLQQLWVGIL